MSRASYVLLAVVVVVASMAVVGWSFFGLGTTPATQPINQTNQQATQSADSSDKGFPGVPVSIQNPAVKWAQVYYTFAGIVKEIKTDPRGAILITNIQGNKIPEFVIGPKTKVYQVYNGKNTEVSSSDLKPNQKVDIRISYGLKQKAWNEIEIIDIILPSDSASAPSPSQN